MSSATALDSLRSRPRELRQLLRTMPKGGDIHSHLIGAVPAETYLRWAAAAGMHLSPDGALRKDPASDCRPAAEALDDPEAVTAIVAAWSLATTTADPARSRAHFFDAFFKFGPAFTANAGLGVAEVAAAAAADNVSYLELMFSPVPRFGYRGAGQPDADSARGLAAELSAAAWVGAAAAGHSRRLDEVEATFEAAATPAARSVLVRYVWEVPRFHPLPIVATLLAEGFRFAERDPRVVGVTLDGDELDPTACRDHDAHMELIVRLREAHPTVPVTLHAGELPPGAGVGRDRIRRAVEAAGAARIGHAIALHEEDDPAGLLARMAGDGVAVETCLTSNERVWGVAGEQHPLRDYLRAGVPVALATDDQGILRTNLSEQFALAVEHHGLGYGDLRRLALASIECSFAPAAERAELRAGLEAALNEFEAAATPPPGSECPPSRAAP